MDVNVYVSNSRNVCRNWDAEIVQQREQLMSKVAEHDPWYRGIEGFSCGNYKCTLKKHNCHNKPVKLVCVFWKLIIVLECRLT